jgi:hypothetical protein
MGRSCQEAGRSGARLDSPDAASLNRVQDVACGSLRDDAVRLIVAVGYLYRGDGTTDRFVPRPEMAAVDEFSWWAVGRQKDIRLTCRGAGRRSCVAATLW